MATITREYGASKVIKLITSCNEGSDIYNKVNSGEDKGNYKYNLIDSPTGTHPYIELEVTDSRWCYKSGTSINRKFEMSNSSVSPKYIFDTVNNEDLIDGKACFFNAFTSATITVDTQYLEPCYNTNITESALFHIWGIVYQDANGQNHVINGSGNYPTVTTDYVSIQGGGNDSHRQYSVVNHLMGSAGACCKCLAKINSTLPIADSLSGALKYVNNGDESELLDGDDSQTSERNINTLYYEAKIYRSSTSTRTNPTLIESHRWEFDVQRYNDDGTEKPKWNRGVFGFVNDSWCSGTSHYNLDFIKNTSTNNLIKIRLDGVEQDKDTFFTTTSTTTPTTGRTTYTENVTESIQSGTFYYYARVNTNMYIFDTLQHARDVISGLSDDLTGIVKKFVGDSIDPMTLQNNELNFDTDMSDTFILDNDDVKALATRFNAYVSADGTIISDLFVGLAMHQNPIDCSIDLFSMPISLTDFVEVESYTVKFSPTLSNNEESN